MATVLAPPRVTEAGPPPLSPRPSSRLRVAVLGGGLLGMVLAAAIVHSQTARVITTVFQTLQALQQNGDDIALRNGADDATHKTPIENVAELSGVMLTMRNMTLKSKKCF